MLRRLRRLGISGRLPRFGMLVRLVWFGRFDRQSPWSNSAPSNTIKGWIACWLVGSKLVARGGGWSSDYTHPCIWYSFLELNLLCSWISLMNFGACSENDQATKIWSVPVLSVSCENTSRNQMAHVFRSISLWHHHDRWWPNPVLEWSEEQITCQRSGLHRETTTFCCEMLTLQSTPSCTPEIPSR
jgi:hypothetical protein